MAAGAVGLSVSSDDPCAHAGQGPGCCLIRQLRLTRVDEGRFTGRLRRAVRSERAFGGGLIAQAVLAAGATAPAGQAPSSVHAYFVSAGDTGRPIRYTVGQLGAGRSSALRQVTADQDGLTRLVMLVSFRRFGDIGAHHQRQAPALGSAPSLAARPETGQEIGSPVYTGGRGLCHGEFYDAAGRLVATCAQEVSLRYVTTPPPESG